MRKASLIAKFTLRMFRGIELVRRVNLQLSLTDFGLMTVLAHDFLEKCHDVTRHLCHPLETASR